MTTLFLEQRTEKDYNDNDIIVKDVLKLEASHSNGTYTFYCNKQTEKRGFIEFMPFNTGNFRYSITTGRKSQKKLDTLNQIIEDNKTELLNLWKDGQYKSMCELVHLQAVQKKIA